MENRIRYCDYSARQFNNDKGVTVAPHLSLYSVIANLNLCVPKSGKGKKGFSRETCVDDQLITLVVPELLVDGTEWAQGCLLI